MRSLINIILIATLALLTQQAAADLTTPLTDNEQMILSNTTDDVPLKNSIALNILLDRLSPHPTSPTATLVEQSQNTATPHSSILNLAQWDEILHAPAAHRGKLYNIQGTLRRIDPNILNQTNLTAWILEIPETKTITIVLIRTIQNQKHAIDVALLPTSVQLTARFYARLQIAPDDPTAALLSVPVFVGESPQIIGNRISKTKNASATRSALMVLFLFVAAALFLIVRIKIARSHNTNASHHKLSHELEDDYDNTIDDDLPEDPATALDELNHRAQASPNDTK